MPSTIPAGAYDIAGPADTTSYRELLKTYARISGQWHTGLPVWGWAPRRPPAITAIALPVPDGLAAGYG